MEPKGLSNVSTLAESTVQIVQSQVRNQALQSFSQAAMADELVNRISLRLLSAAQIPTGPEKWARQQFIHEVEQYFAELQTYCFHYALKLTEHPETAEDIAQDSIRELLSCNQQISCIKAWLSKVTHNKVVKHKSLQSKDSSLGKQLADRNVDNSIDAEADNFPAQLSKPELKKLLSRKDYSTWQAIQNSPSLKAYAATQQISYQTAKEHKHRIRVNLRSAYLKQQGWLDSPAILSYQQLTVIKRFLNNLLATFGEAHIEGKAKNSVYVNSENLCTAFQGCKSIYEWAIRILGEREFDITVVGETSDLPAVISLKIKLNKANRICITHCKKGTIIAQMPSGDAKLFTIHKGRAHFNYDELLSLVPKATVYDAEQFAEMLEKHKPK